MMAGILARNARRLDGIDHILVPRLFVRETRWVAVAGAHVPHVEIALDANRVVRGLAAVRDALAGPGVLEADPRSGVADVHHPTLGERNRDECRQRGERAVDGHPTKEATRSNRMHSHSSAT